MMQDRSLPQAATLHKIHEKADVKRPAKGRTGHGAQQVSRKAIAQGASVFAFGRFLGKSLA